MGIRPLLQLRPLAVEFWQFSPYKLSASLGLMLLASITSGVGILMIVPLMASIGIDITGTSSTNGLAHSVEGWAAYLGIQLDLVTVLGIYVLIMLALGGLSYLNASLSVSLRQAFVTEMRSNMSRDLFQAQWRYLNQRHMSDFMRLLIGQIQSAAVSLNFMLRLLSSLVLLCVYLVFSLLLSSTLTLIALLFGLALAALLWPINKRIYSSGHTELSANRDIHRGIFENLSSLKVIKSFAAEERYLAKMYKANVDLEEQQVRITKIAAFVGFINKAGAAIIFALLFFTSITWLQIPVSNLLVILFIFSRLMPQISSIQTTFQSLVHKAPAYQDLLENRASLVQWKENAAQSGDAPTLHKKITLQDVDYQYPDTEKQVLSGFSADIGVNETVAIVGPSGVGKSTLADILSGLIEPTAGNILIDDQIVDKRTRVAWRKQVAYVTQDVFLFHDTVRENLIWVCDPEQFASTEEREKEIERVLKLAAADKFVADLPHGLDTLIGDRGVKLSGGERQRLALARALLSKPCLLILDEATSALDRNNELKIRDALVNLDGKLTIVVIAHNDTTIEHVSAKIAL